MKKTSIWAGSVLIVVITLSLIVSFLIEKPLRQYVQDRMNRQVEGYRVEISDLDLHLLGLSVDLEGITMTQTKHPSPPVAAVGSMDARVHWRSMLRGRLVADFHIRQPVVHLNLDNLRAEQEDRVPVDKKGWQEMLQSAYPFKINVIRVSDGQLTYIDQEKFEPIMLSNIHFTAHNIRNIEVADSMYPSPIRLEASVLETGAVTVLGNANFLAEPFPGIQAQFNVDRLQLAYFKTVAARFNIDLGRGVLGVKGNIEFSPDKKIVKLDSVLLREIGFDYAFTGKEKKKTQKGKRGDPAVAVTLTIEQLKIEKSEFGLVNRAADPDYRVFISNMDAAATNLSTGFTGGPAKVELHGRFMGTGETEVYGNFRSERKGPDFDLRAAITNTDMKKMNNIFRAYGKFDVAAGKFSFFSELHVRNGKIRGYVKPLFKDMNVYDERQDEEKNLFRKTYERIVGGLSELLENPREDVATKAPISGSVENPDAGTWATIANLVRNAFFRSILPGFAESIE